jgi:arylsulfatase A-like enzyme
VNKTGCFLVLVSSILATESVWAQEPKKKRPNIIFILVDDQRNTSLGIAGDPYVQTPTIDRLARKGVRFENAFVTTAICMASRATILTGLSERTHGYSIGNPPVPARFVQTAYPSVLRSAGYTTAFFGKFGVKMEGNPNEELFDSFGSRDRPYLKKQPDGSIRHVDEINTEQATNFLARYKSDTPFCLSISFSSTHAEDSDKENHYPSIDAVEGMYEEINFPEPRLSSPEIYDNQPELLKSSLNRTRYFWRWDTPEKYQKNMRAYYRLVTGVDVMVRRVLDALEKTGEADNTIIIYTADNGYYMGDRGFAGKWSHYEESLRVPLIIYDPRLPQQFRGKVLDPMVLNMDLPATILDMAGVEVPDHYQGRSLAPWLRLTEVDGWRADFFAEHRAVHPQLPTWEGIRTEHFTYARYDGVNPPLEMLHDLQVDPDQLRNLVGVRSYGDTLTRLRGKTDAFRDTYLAAHDVRPGDGSKQ